VPYEDSEGLVECGHDDCDYCEECGGCHECGNCYCEDEDVEDYLEPPQTRK